MIEPYPVRDQRPLTAASRRKLLGMKVGEKARRSHELPATTAHEVLVYRVGSRFRVDNGLGLSHEDVVNATHVSTVDMTHNRQVVVELPIPSRDSEMFHVMATFTCTVTEPLIVVEKGIDAEQGLLSYLKGHHKIALLGLEYELRDINEVRIDVQAEVGSLADHRPPALPGMLVTLASVEVATPAELTEFHQKLRGLERTHTLDTTEQGYQQIAEERRQGFANEQEVTQQQHVLSLRSTASDAALRELGKAKELVGTDPMLALQYALHAGQLDAREYATQLQANADRVRDDERHQAELAHDARMLELGWTREDKLRATERAEKDQQFRRALGMEILGVLSKRGYLDTIDPEALVTEVLGELTAGGKPGPATPQLPAADAAGATSVVPAPAADGLIVREEDGD
jgi:hypothetical protein